MNYLKLMTCPKCSETLSFLLRVFLMWNRALTTVSCTFCRPHLPQVLQSPQIFTVLCDQLMMWMAYEIELSLQSCALFRDYFPRSSRETTETETLLRRPRQPLYPKKTGFRTRQCFQTWIHAFPISHTSQLFAWWCGCHDDWGDDVVAIMVRKLAMTIGFLTRLPLKTYYTYTLIYNIYDIIYDMS